MKALVLVIATVSLLILSCTQHAAEGKAKMLPSPKITNPVAADATTAELIVAGGCFWCIEGAFEQLHGVIDAESGYAGGDPAMADYKAVCTGKSGHAEVVKIKYNPQEISFATLLHIFFSAHDPTTLNRQGPDRGTQYRSSIFYKDDKEKAAAEAYMKQLTEAKSFNSPIVTKLEKLDKYFAAEKYHQDFARLNPQHPYILQQSKPKAEKVCKLFPKQLKSAVAAANKNRHKSD